MWVLSLLLGVLVVLAITAATGYFVAQEFAYMAVDRSRLKAREAAGDTAAGRALAVTRRTSFMLSGAQLGITVTALLVGYVAEPLIGESLGDALGGVGVPTGVGIAVGTVLALVLSTFVQMIFGELFPKNLAIARPEQVAVRLASSTTLYLRLLGWLIRIFDAASNQLLRLLRIEPVHDVEHSATVRDLEHIVADSRTTGDLPEELSVLLDRILDFPERDAEHAMVPRARVDVVRGTATVGDVRALMGEGHSRYPVVDEQDDVVGVVHLQDVLAATDLDAPVTSLARPAVLVAEVTLLPDVLETLGRRKDQMACVVDEHGGFAGVITVEDLAEELVGEIDDEHDGDAHELLVATGEGSWEARGEVPLDEVERVVDRHLPRGEHETLSGLVIAAHGTLPDVGEVVEVPLLADPAALAADEPPPAEALRLEVLDVQRHVPALVRVSLVEVEPVQVEPVDVQPAEVEPAGPAAAADEEVSR